MTFARMPEAERKRVVEALVGQFGEGCRGFLADKVWLVRGNHSWLATQQCLPLLALKLNVQQPGLLALVDVRNGKASRELSSLLAARHP